MRSLALREVLFGDDGATGQPVGILLPPGVPGALANLAALNAGHVPVNLHDTPELLHQEIERTVHSPEEINEEIQHLFRVFA